MKNRLLRFLSFIASSNLVIATAAASGVFAGSLVLELERQDELIAMTFFATLFVYNFQRRVGTLKLPPHTKHSSTIWMLVSAPFVLLLLPQLDLDVILILGVCGVLSFAYAIPFIPSSDGKVSLRLVPRLKFWIIMFVWTFSVILIPAIEMHLWNTSVLLYFLMQFLFIGALTIVFDIQDLKVDLPSQRTIPQALGVAGARRLAVGMLLASAFASALLVFLGGADDALILAQCSLILVAILVVKKARPENHPLYFSVAIDGLIILQAVTFYLAKNLF
jgi:4-hydroxybenzoate polyprenyltransferase